MQLPIKLWRTVKTNLFKSRHTTNEVQPNIITGSKVRKNLRSKFWMPKDIMKVK